MTPPSRLLVSPLVVVVFLGCATESQKTEARLAAMQLRTQERQAAGDVEGALALLPEMAAVDPGHPKPYIRLVLIELGRGGLDQVPAELDQLGLRDAAGRLYADGMLAFFRGATSEADASFSRALELYTTRRHAAGQAACHTALGNVRDAARDFDAAVAAFEAAIPLLQEIRDRWGLADVHGNLAKVERERGDAAAALEHQREVLELREGLRDREGQARSWSEIGAALARSGAAADAVAAFERAFSIHGDLGDMSGQIRDLRAIASARLEAGASDDAVARLERALAIAAGTSDRSLAAGVSRQLGETLVAIGRTREGAELLGQAISTFLDLDDRRQVAATRAALGRARVRLGELAPARALLQESLAAAEELEDAALIADAATELGNLHLANGEPVQALLLQERAIELHRGMEDRIGERIGFHNLGAIYFAMGDLERSRRSLEEALRLAGELHDAAGVARARNMLGAVLAAQGRLEQARVEFEAAARGWESLDAPRSRALTGANLAEVLGRLGRGEEAATLLAGALAGFRGVGDVEGEAFALNLHGDLALAGGDREAALAAHHEALALATEHGFAEERLRAHAGMAAALRARGEVGAAVREALLALDEIDRLRAGLAIDTFKSQFLAGKMAHYERAVDLLVGDAGSPSAENLSAAFQVVERGRARSLVDLLAESGARLTATADPELVASERGARDELTAALATLAGAADAAARAAARERVRLAEAELERLAIEIRYRDPRYGEIAYPQPLTLSAVREAVLQDGEELLEYFIGEEKAWLWRVGRHSAALVRLPPPAEIRATVNEWLDAIERSGSDPSGRASEVEAAARVARALLPPDPLPAGQRLIVVPDGPLHHLPFEALPSGGRLLIEDHEVVVAPAAGALQALRRQAPPAPSGFLGIADPIPAVGDPQFARLPHSREEVATIAALFPATARTVLAGEAATKERLRALALDRFRFVHFASHAWVDAEDLRRSGLRLTPAGEDAGSALLSLDEIAALDLRAELVVLSACRSGGGELLRGEGLVGLTRAFLYAGTRAVVVSLWDVGDRSTAEFMRLFYRGLEAGQSPAAALRAAKLAFLASDRPLQRSVRQWAAFIMVGDPRYPDGRGSWRDASGLPPGAEAISTLNHAAGAATESTR